MTPTSAPRTPAATAGTDRPTAEVVRELVDRFSTISEGGEGVTRLAYTELERQAHVVFAQWMSARGLSVRTDAAGNTIAELPGVGGLHPALGTGSHLDSVPHGGRFDGIAGVVAAMITADHVVASGTPFRHDLRFVAFAAEEGARFGQACTGSKIVAGQVSTQTAWSLRDRAGTSLAEAMDSVGLDVTRLTEARWDPADWAAFIELHVEQGAVLEQHDTPIGVVELVSGSTRLAVTLIGQATHSGSTPMALRRDALVAGAELVLIAESLATDSRHHGTRITVGRFEVFPDSTTTIPGEVRLTVDVRDVDGDRQRQTVAELVRHVRTACERRGIEVAVDVLADISPVILPRMMREVIVDAAREEQLDFRLMASGASHDAQVVNGITPTGMIFVPSRAGISHEPGEWTEPDDIARGAAVLLGALRRLDAEGGGE